MTTNGVKVSLKVLIKPKSKAILHASEQSPLTLKMPSSDKQTQIQEIFHNNAFTW